MQVLVVTKTPASVLIKSDLENDFCYLRKIDPQTMKESKELSDSHGPFQLFILDLRIKCATVFSAGLHSVGYYVYEVGEFCTNLVAGQPMCVAAIRQVGLIRLDRRS